ncbi:MSHA biogenesis protein MshK [Shewanella sp. SNU WT4]|uniref:MSHA biogenesis protein MshK n=1 Tax=Shewanella sp. SNU WT4 TaxID=2590015 RepID=UPI001129843F|nr:MSHA biogenesis protein MshK [Shewanella sp. SNU WT4]QDF68320.1 MSHA biogenesis protein MshK [Shewanella sp. SNU WT4]
MWRINLSLSLLLLVCCSHSAWAEMLRDPTRPLVSSGAMSGAHATANRGLKLHSIVTSASRRYALINNQLYQVGSKIADTQIQRITDNSVILADGRKLVVFQGVTSQLGTQK